MFPAASTATAMGLTWQVRLSGLGSDDGSGGAATLVHAADGKVMYSVVAPVLELGGRVLLFADL